jgi:spore germination cell wall hydrolase CwlJ-like protein
MASADRRVLISAALIGSGVGLALGAAYMGGGMARAVTDHSRAERIAVAASDGFSETALQQEASAMSPGAVRIALRHDLFATAITERNRQAAMVAAGLEPNPASARTALQSSRELDCMTQVVYFEARGETPRGQAAVAQVVLNRVRSPAFPKTVCGVVYQGANGRGCQFSFACDGSMTRAREASAWRRARTISARALSGVVLADIGSATHFHTTQVSPDWGPGMLRVAQVGLHIFYRFGHAPGRPAEPVMAPPGQVEFRLASALAARPQDAVAPTPAAPAAVPQAPAQPEAKAVAEPTPPAVTKTSEVAARAPAQAPTAS